MTKNAFLLLSVIFMASLALAANAQSVGGFGNGARPPFFQKELNQPNSYSLVRDPQTNSGKRNVHRFQIDGSVCVKHDCSYNSVRSELVEDVYQRKKFGKGQPKEAWYGWEVLFPNGFPSGPRQTKGGYLFGQWHNGVCPHLSFYQPTFEGYTLFLRTNHTKGCKPSQQIPILDMRDIEGKWTSFEVFVRWSTKEDGRVIVYVNGVEKVDYTGRTMTLDVPDVNHFDFGIYLPNTPSLKSIKPATVYYRNVNRQNSRNRLHQFRLSATE